MDVIKGIRTFIVIIFWIIEPHQSRIKQPPGLLFYLGRFESQFRWVSRHTAVFFYHIIPEGFLAQNNNSKK